MGNSEISCLTGKGLNKGEMSVVKKEYTALDPEYKEKVTSDETLKVLAGDKMRAAQHARTYDKGTVKVSVY